MGQYSIVMGPVLLGPVSDCSANYRPVLSSESVYHFNNKAIVRLKKKKSKNLVMGRLTIGCNINDNRHDAL
jgi:hypothetical protein